MIFIKKQMTASCSLGKTAIGHDNRVFLPGNVDPELSKNNEYLIRCHTIRAAYNEIFTDAVNDYNSRQKRKDRKIASYYDKIRDSKNGEHLTYEYVLQVGSRETNPTGGEYEEVSKEIYRKWLNDFTSGQDSLRVVNASIHCDEPNGTPHMHITIVPVAKYSRGLALRNSLSGAMKELGYAKASDWCLDVQMELGELLKEKGIEYIQLGTHREHIENGLFQELMEKEQAKVETELSKTKEEIAGLKEEQEALKSQMKKFRKQHTKLEEKNSELEQDNNFLSIQKNWLSEDIEDLDRKIESKKGILAGLEEKIERLLASVKTKVSEVINELTVRNTKKRLEKTLEHMPAGTVNEFKDKWNMYGTELPCFKLKYEPPTRERIEADYYAPWKPLLHDHAYSSFDRNQASTEFSRLIHNGEFSESEANWIIRVIGGTLKAEKEDIERSLNVAFKTASDHYAERVEATPEDLQRKYLGQFQDLDRDDRDWDLSL